MNDFLKPLEKVKFDGLVDLIQTHIDDSNSFEVSLRLYNTELDEKNLGSKTKKTHYLENYPKIKIDNLTLEFCSADFVKEVYFLSSEDFFESLVGYFEGIGNCSLISVKSGIYTIDPYHGVNINNPPSDEVEIYLNKNKIPHCIHKYGHEE